MRRHALRYPFLRWIGGKQRTAVHLLPFVPPVPEGSTYWEPFAGAASLFLRVAPKRAVLSDTNAALVQLYRDVKRRPDLVWRYLRRWSDGMNKAKYTAVRSTFNSLPAGPHRSALFIVLNRTCFNGIWRVNRDGAFNVPFGRIYRPILPTHDDLRSLSAALHGTRLLTGDFEKVLRSAKSGDFVYLDPPYPPVNGTAFFTHYTRDRFITSDQERLAGVAASLSDRGCNVMLSTAGSKWIRDLYTDFDVVDLHVTRYVAAGGVRHRVTDILVKNYAVAQASRVNGHAVLPDG